MRDKKKRAEKECMLRSLKDMVRKGEIWQKNTDVIRKGGI